MCGHALIVMVRTWGLHMMPLFPSEPHSKHINNPLLHFTYSPHSRPDSCCISPAYTVVSGPVSYLPLARCQHVPHRAGDKTFKMIIQITRLPCLKPFCGFPSWTEGDQIPDHGLQGPAPSQPSSLWLRHGPSGRRVVPPSGFLHLLFPWPRMLFPRLGFCLDVTSAEAT